MPSHLLAQAVDGKLFPFVYFLLSFVPLGLLLLALVLRQRRFQRESKSPFTDLLLRPPGESLRLKISVLEDELTSLLCILSALLFLPLASLSFFPAQERSIPAVGLLLLMAFAAFAFHALKLWKLQEIMRNHRLGFEGERVVGEELNQLLAEGFKVFHDLPFEGFNIDHVVVGPAGVYAVETKTRRKPANTKGRAEVEYDGEKLIFPWGNDTFGLEQAQLNAKTLAKWLTSSTGERTEVQAILTLPGWWIKRSDRGPVSVVNSKEIRRVFPKRIDQPLSPERIQRIVHQLSEKCRMEVG